MATSRKHLTEVSVPEKGKVAQLVDFYMTTVHPMSEPVLARRVGVSPSVIHYLRVGHDSKGRPYIGVRVRRRGDEPLLHRVQRVLGIPSDAVDRAVVADQRNSVFGEDSSASPPITYKRGTRNSLHVVPQVSAEGLG